MKIVGDCPWRWKCLLSLVVSFLFLPISSVSAQSGQITIRSIEIRGNQHIETAAIESRLTVQIGDSLTREITRDQIRRIFEMGFFEDVQVLTEPLKNGVQVVFAVKEKPFIAEFLFDGNENISEDKLKEVAPVRSQVFLDQQQVKETVEKVRQAYQDSGYYSAQVIPVIQMLGETRTRLTFFIQEGERTRVKTVDFVGATAVTKNEMLDVMATREYVWLISWITDAGTLRREEIPNDVERIKEVYMNKGYLDVQVSLPTIELNEDKKWFTVTFQIVEGEPYTVDSVRLEGNEVFTDEELRKGLTIKPGEVFQRTKLREEVTRITDLYGERGYSFAEVLLSINPNTEELSTEVVFTIQEGNLIRVREVKITGNDKTRDNVIRRELRVNEREVINSVSVKRSFERLNNLNFFETVEIIPEQVSENEVDLDVKVKEKPTGSFSIGGGFSTLDSFTLIADITEGNLFGRGYTLRVRGQLGVRRSLGVVSFRNPALYDSQTSMQLDLFRNNTDFQTFTEDRTGGTVTFGRSFSEFLAGSLTLVAERIKIDDIDVDAAEIIQDQDGTQSTTGFRGTLFRDTRDFFTDPRRGYRTGARVGLGTDLLGGSNNFYNLALDAQRYTPFPFGDLRWSIRGRFGFADGYRGDDLPVSEFFFVGGINTVRGFEFGRAGPVTPSSGDPEGGSKQLILNNELIFPILAEAKLNGVLFYDYGEGFADGESLDLNLRSGAGVELRWISPFGPLRVAWGKNLDQRSGEKSTVIEFSVGSLF